MGRLLIFLMGLGAGGEALAQYSTEHYIPPLYYHEISAGTGSGNDDQPYGPAGGGPADSINVHLTTMATSNVSVVIYDGNGSTVANYTISKTNPVTHGITCTNPAAGDAECDYLYADATGTTDGTKGLRITASQPIYVRMDLDADPQGASVTSKGSFAKGQEFYAAHFVHTYEDNTGNFISFMATESSTSVTVTPPSGCSWSGGTTFSLNAYQSAVVANQDWSNDCIGTKITANKDIVVVSGSWSGRIGNDNTGRDMGADQLIPAPAYGSSYLIHEGYPSTYTGAKAIVVAKEASTQVSVNGTLRTTLAAQDWYEWDLSNSLDAITATKDVTVYYQGYSTSNKSANKNQGFMVLAPIEDTNSADGSTHVNVADLHHLYDTSDGNVSYYILTQDTDVGVTFDDSSMTLASFDNSSVLSRSLNGTIWYLYRRIEDTPPSTNYNVIVESNSGKPIHVWAGFGKQKEGAYANFSAFKDPVNTPPTTDHTLIAGTEDTVYIFSPSDFPFTDSDGDTLSKIKVVSIPSTEWLVDGTWTYGVLYLDTNLNDLYDDGIDTVLVDNDEVTEAELAAGLLQYHPVENVNKTLATHGLLSDGFDFQVSDGVDYSDSFTQALIELTNVDDPATFAGDLSGTGPQDNDIMGTLEPEDVDGLTGDDPLTWSPLEWPICELSIDATNGTATAQEIWVPLQEKWVCDWTYTPNSGFVGTDSFTILVTDDFGSTTTQVITITVEATDSDGDGVNDNDDDCNTTDGDLSADFDGDGCDDADEDSDDDNDGVDDGTDDNSSDPNVCADADGDGCDDCAITGADGSGGDTNNDGADWDSDGLCDVTDPANTPPTTSQNFIVGTEDTVYVFSASDFPFTDSDNDTLDNIKMVSVPSISAVVGEGILYLDMNSNELYDDGTDQVLVDNDEVTEAELAAGLLQYNPIENANQTVATHGSVSDTFTFQVSDGVDYSGNGTIFIQLTNVEDPTNFWWRSVGYWSSRQCNERRSLSC